MYNLMKKKTMFVYGSLKEGFLNHHLIGEIPLNKKMGKGFVRGFKLYALHIIPALKKSGDKDDRVLIEKYNLIEPCFEMIDEMEKRAGYIPVEVEDNEGVKGTIYVFQGEVKQENHIPRGVWSKNFEKMIVEEPKEESKN